MIRAEHLAGGNPEEEGITDLTGRTGHRNTNGFLTHGGAQYARGLHGVQALAHDKAKQTQISRHHVLRDAKGVVLVGRIPKYHE